MPESWEKTRILMYATEATTMDEKARKAALRMIPYGLYVIGLKGFNKVGAFSASWVMQCSFNPHMVLIGVKRDGIGPDLLDQGKVFSINFLSKEDVSTAEYFFNPPDPASGGMGDKKYSTETTGAPILDNAIAYLECEVARVVDEHGDHIIYIGNVVNAGIRSEEPALELSDTSLHYGG
jgi:flavin reductase (DIM6/NTAB) family NADH-FMN oxidoreductase RutF